MKLLRVAVSDPSPEVRRCMILALDSRYDLYLCQAHHLSTLFLLVQDEIFAIRASALKLLGRLAVMNPAYVLPSLRKVLMRIILELQCNGDTGVRESATRTLIVFLRASSLQRLVRPFLRSLISVLPLNNPNRYVAPRLAAAALEALGELAIVVQEDVRPWLHELIPHIIRTMQDQSSVSKQQVRAARAKQAGCERRHCALPPRSSLSERPLPSCSCLKLASLAGCERRHALPSASPAPLLS